jgi:hypothetical protein
MVHRLVQQPLTASFMLVSMLGFFVSVFYIWDISTDWGFAFAFVFTTFFVASVYNFTHAPDEDFLAVHEPQRHTKHLKK